MSVGDAESEQFQVSLGAEEIDERGGTIVIVNPVGEIDLTTAPELREVLIRLVTMGMNKVVVDLADVSFIDSSGLAVLVAASKRFRAANGWLATRNPRPQARQILELTALERILAVDER